MNDNIVGPKFDNLSEEEMAFIVGGDGATPMSVSVISTYTASYVVSTAVSILLSGGAVSWIASAWARCA